MLTPDERSRFLLSVVAAQVNGSRQEKDALVGSTGMQVDELVQLAMAHGIGPLLYRALGTELRSMSADVLGRLTHHVRQRARVNVELTAELIRATRLLAQEGVEALSFKGPTLAFIAYGSLSARPFRDVDLLVCRRDTLQGIRILAGTTWEPLGGLPQGVRWRLLCRDDNHIRLRHQQTDHILEVHWDLATPHSGFRFDLEGIWARCVELELGGARIRTFAPEDLALYTCFHGWKHNWERLSWLCDLAALTTRCPQIDWRVVLDRGREAGMLRIVLVSTLLAQDLLGVRLPQACSDALAADPGAAEVVRLGCTRMAPYWSRAAADPTVVEAVPPFLLMRHAEGVPRRFARFIRRVVQPMPADLDFLHLPGWLFRLYYVTRPVRLSLKYLWLGGHQVARVVRWLRSGVRAAVGARASVTHLPQRAAP